MSLNKHATEDLKWWLGVPNAKNNINTSLVDFEINTDASETGWGATDGSSSAWGSSLKMIRPTTLTTWNY